MESVSYKILDEFHLTAALRAGLMEKILDGQVANLHRLNNHAGGHTRGEATGTGDSLRDTRRDLPEQEARNEVQRYQNKQEEEQQEEEGQQEEEEDDVALAAEDDSTL